MAVAYGNAFVLQIEKPSLNYTNAWIMFMFFPAV